MRARASGCSFQGSRKYNEDTIFYEETDTGFLAAVADGLGGHGGGAEASDAAVRSFVQGFRETPQITEENLRSLLEQANRIIRDRQTERQKMRTTFVSLVCGEKEWAAVHVGDSRLYWFQNGFLRFRTLDHSVSQMAALAGEIGEEQIRFHEDRNKVLRALGGTEMVRPDIMRQEGSPAGSAFLLCTDGFWENVWEDEMLTDLLKSGTPKTWLSYMLARIGRRMDEKSDNLSAVAVFIPE
ncbi:serine/threonine-protein phosphatase [Lacrimispora sp. NSJ-141]|uniref:Serine/threonine-protein phosphatase n=1 Tax=Lientehia hominis TaxID=2897778 RepID=A0AAP2RJK8_9FIRM|nr:PP2C family serine/threonine-protein phosphatase [Lientehia hominis]MCD2493021.1 serine/threonine-protein phosphatase [Lientehia hominis]